MGLNIDMGVIAMVLESSARIYASYRYEVLGPLQILVGWLAFPKACKLQILSESTVLVISVGRGVRELSGQNTAKWRLPLDTGVDGEEAVGGCLRTWYLMKEDGVGKHMQLGSFLIRKAAL